MKNIAQLVLLLVVLSAGLACDHGHDHSNEDGHHAEGAGGHDDHGAAKEAEADAHGHGHGFEGASEVVTRWGKTTQLFVEFPALVANEDSPFAGHFTRLTDHFAFDKGKVVVELSSKGGAVERFSVDGPSVPGIFRPIVKPASTGKRHMTLRIESPSTSETHDLGEFTVFATREEANAAAKEGPEPDGLISYLLEQQWKVPFRVEEVKQRPMRPNFPAFARLSLPSDAQVVVTAPRDGRITAVDGKFPVIGGKFAAGAALFDLSSAPQGGADPATLDLAIDRASIQVDSAKREVNRLQPLVNSGVVARKRLDEVTSRLAHANAELRSARRQRSSLGKIERVEGARDGFAVPNPIAGSIAELFVAPGSWVSKGDKLARVVNSDRLWLDVGVPESYLGRLGSISGAWFRLDNVPGVFDVPKTALVSVGTEVDATRRTLPVRFHIDNAQHKLFAGMTAQAHLIADAPRNVVALPIAAVVDDGGTDVVFIQDGGETFLRRAVRLGVRDGDYVEVLGDVQAGQWVVTRGAYSVRLASTSTAAIGHGHAH